MQDSVTLFQAALEGIPEPEPFDLTPSEREAALAEATREMRKNHFNDIQNKRKKGEILYNALRVAGDDRVFEDWIIKQQDLYFTTEGEEGFYIGGNTAKDRLRTPKNYINVHLLYMHFTSVYEKYRHFPAWLVYRVASCVLDGGDAESVPAIQAIRAKEAGLMIEETAGGSASVPNCGIPAEFEALIEMCESGEISQLEAGRIVDRCQIDGAEQVVIDAVKFCGVRDTDCVLVLESVVESMDRAGRNGEPYNNILQEAMATLEAGGLITTADGQQIELRKLSHREIWSAYCRSRHKEPGSGGGSKFASLFDETISHEDALKIARDLDDQELIDAVTDDDEHTDYKLTFRKPL